MLLPSQYLLFFINATSKYIIATQTTLPPRNRTVTSTLPSLPPQQMKQWLLALHHQQNQPPSKDSHQQIHKTKYIQKVFNRNHFKEHIITKIPGKIRAAIRGSREMEYEKPVGKCIGNLNKEGKLNFKSTSHLQKSVKVESRNLLTKNSAI